MESVFTNIHGNVAKGFILNSDFSLEPCYIVKAQNFFAHGKTLQEAQRDLEEKVFDELDAEEKIKLFIEKFNLDNTYPVKES